MQINETLFREGQQALNPKYKDRGVVFSRNEQLGYAERIARAGVHYIEIGAPVRSPYGLETAKQLVELTRSTPNTQIAVHGRATTEDIDAFLATGATRLHLFRGTSNENRNGNGNISIEQIITDTIRAIEYARSKRDGLFIRFGAEDAFRTPIEDLEKVIIALAPYVDLFSLPDTTGRAIPSPELKLEIQQLSVYEIVEYIRELSGRGIQFHGHNDSGLALPNYLAALAAGAEVFDTSVYHLGERNGIPSAKDLILALRTKNNAQLIKLLYNLDELHRLDQDVAAKFGQELPPNDLYGQNVTTDTSGVHAAATLNHHLAYDANGYDRERQIIFASAVTGKAAVAYRASQLGIIPPAADIRQNAELKNRVMERALEAAMRIQETAKIQGDISPNEADEIIKVSFQGFN
jgi:homocitrate synthase